jgi:hypothetical protein
MGVSFVTGVFYISFLAFSLTVGVSSLIYQVIGYALKVELVRWA